MIYWHICSLVCMQNLQGKHSVSSYQLVLIADPYSDHRFLKKNDAATKKEMSKM